VKSCQGDLSWDAMTLDWKMRMDCTLLMPQEWIKFPNSIATGYGLTSERLWCSFYSLLCIYTKGQIQALCELRFDEDQTSAKRINERQSEINNQWNAITSATIKSDSGDPNKSPSQ